MNPIYKKTIEQYSPFEVILHGKTQGNPFTDYTIFGTFAGEKETLRAEGFYDVIDEMCYEGDIDQGWGNITQQEMSHRCWEVAMRGGYIGHGETYVHSDDLLWWSHGGVLHGESEVRIAFLRRILEEVPGQCVKTKAYSWDMLAACPDNPVLEDGYYLFYFGIKRPSYRNFRFDDGFSYKVEIIDTWNMTVSDAGIHKGWFRIPMPGRQYMALRMTKV